MSAPTLAFFNSKVGVGKTSLLYHLAWILAERGENILACDLDPQANLTALFLAEDELENLWDGACENRTIYQCIRPSIETGEINEPEVVRIGEALHLIPGDLALSGLEGDLSSEWTKALGNGASCRPFGILTAFWQAMQLGAESIDASLILVDVGPNLGALNRAALIAADHVISPVGGDLYSLRALRSLGPALAQWRTGWSKRREHWRPPQFELPQGRMNALGYVIQQNAIRDGRPARAHTKWFYDFPQVYAQHVVGEHNRLFPATPNDDTNCLAIVKEYRSLNSIAREARKPIFFLTPADGAISSHARATIEAYEDFRALAGKVMERIVEPTA